MPLGKYAYCLDVYPSENGSSNSEWGNKQFFPSIVVPYFLSSLSRGSRSNVRFQEVVTYVLKRFLGVHEDVGWWVEVLNDFCHFDIFGNWQGPRNTPLLRSCTEAGFC